MNEEQDSRIENNLPDIHNLTESNTKSSTIAHNNTANELPKWVKILFRAYAILQIGSVLVVFLFFLHSFTLDGRYLVLLNTNASSLLLSFWEAWAFTFFVFGLVLLGLEIFYVINIFKFKRWVLPVIVPLSFGTILNSALSVIYGTELLVGLAGLAIPSLVVFAGIKYWNMFEGSSKKLLIQIPLLMVTLPFIILPILSQMFADDLKINDSDLRLEQIEVLPQSNNAHYYLPVINELSTEKTQEYESAVAFAKELKEGAAWDASQAIEHLENVKSLTANFIQASNRQVYQCPTLVNYYNFSDLPCGLNDIRDMAVIMAMKAATEAANNNINQSIETSMAIVRMGKLMSNSEQLTIIEYLVSIELMRTGVESLEETIANQESPVATEALSVEVIDELSGYMMDGSSLVASFRRDYADLKEEYKTFQSLSSYFYQHNKTVNELAEFTRQRIKVAAASCDAEYMQKAKEFDVYYTDRLNRPLILLMISPNSSGQILNQVVTAGSFSSIKQKECELNELNTSLQELLLSLIVTDFEGLYKHTFSVQGMAETLQINKDGTYTYSNSLPGASRDASGNLESDKLDKIIEYITVNELLDIKIVQKSEPNLLCDGRVYYEIVVGDVHNLVKSPCVSESTNETKEVFQRMEDANTFILDLLEMDN